MNQLLGYIADNLGDIERIFFNYVNTPFYKNFSFWTAIAASVSSFLAIILAFWGEAIRKNQMKSDLKIAKIPKPYKQPAETIGRIVIKNYGRFPATEVEANTEKLLINGKEKPNFLPCPLNWTHSQLYSDKNSYYPQRNIHPDQSVHLDIFSHISKDNLRLALVVCKEDDNYAKLEKGENELTVNLFQKSGQTVTLNLKITYDGENVPIIKEEIK